MSYPREGQVIDEYKRPVPGASVYVFKEDGTQAALTSDGATPLAQPLTTDEFGNYAYQTANAAVYREDTYFAGKLRFREIVAVGLDGLYPPGPRGGMFFAFDATGNPVASAGTGADAGLRTDLAASTGFTLVKYKNADANAYGRSGAQLKAMGADDSDGLNLIHFVNPNEDDALIANSGVSALDSAFTNALANLSATQASSGRKTRLLLPGFVFPVAATLDFDVPDLVVDGGRAAKILSSFDGKVVGFNGDNMVCRGLHIHQGATGADPAPYLEDNAAGGIIEDNTFTRDATAHIPFYVREGASGGRFLRNACTWYGGLNLISNVKNYAICHSSFVNPVDGASDDAIAIKAVAGTTEHILIGWNYMEGMADLVGIGSEIGADGADDPTFSSRAEAITIVGNTGKNCAYGLFVKPGAVDGNDKRDGRVRGVIFSENTLRDDLGTNMQNLIKISVGRGAGIESVTGRDNKAIGRCKTGASKLYGQHIYLADYGVGSADPYVDLIDVGFALEDPYEGVANGVVVSGIAAPGEPWSQAAGLERQTVGVGTASRVTLDCAANGTSNNGISIAEGYDGTHIRRARLTNVNTGGSTTPGGIFVTGSDITVGTDIQIDILAGYPYKLASGASVTCPELSEDLVLFNADVPAGTAKTAYPWEAERRCQLVRARVGTTNTVAQDDTNYTYLALKNTSGTDLDFAVARTKVTPEGGNDIAIALTAGLRTTIYDFASLTLDSQRTQTLFEAGQTLHIDKAEIGTGAALNGARLSLYPLPY